MQEPNSVCTSKSDFSTFQVLDFARWTMSFYRRFPGWTFLLSF